MTTPTPEHPALTAVRKSGSSKVKVAVSDIDGILRGKYLHIDKFLGAAEPAPAAASASATSSSAGTSPTRPTTTPSSPAGSTAFPTRSRASTSRTAAQRAVGRQRAVLPRRVRQRRTHTPSPICPRQTLEARARARREAGLRGDVRAWSSSGSTSSRRRRRWAAKQRRRPGADHAGHVRLLAAAHEPQPRVHERADGRDARLRRADRGPAHRDRARASTRSRSLFGEALEQADRAILFKTGAKEIGARFGIMPSFMAKWNAKYPGCSGHIHQSLKDGKDGKTNLFYDAKSDAQDEPAVRELPRRPGRVPDGVRADVLADDQQLQAPRRRLLGAGQADLGHRQPHRELSRHRRQPEGDAARDALPGRRRQSVPRDGGGASPPACTASRRA